MTIIERERNELNRQLLEDGLDCPESIFIRQALDLLAEREKNVQSTTKIFVVKPKEVVTDTVDLDHEAVDFELEKLKLNVAAKPFVSCNAENFVENDEDKGAAAFLANFVIDEETNLTLHDIDIQPTVNDSNFFYFYQAADGQHLYLQSINVRMLQMMYGSLDRAPRTIRGKIVQKESCSMTEDLRKRLKYLQHLPVTSQFDVVEILLEQPIVSADVLAKFKGKNFCAKKLYGVLC